MRLSNLPPGVTDRMIEEQVNPTPRLNLREPLHLYCLKAELEAGRTVAFYYDEETAFRDVALALVEYGTPRRCSIVPEKVLLQPNELAALWEQGRLVL